MKWSEEIVKKKINSGLAIDATYGGLILGRSHNEGGIYFWIREKNDYVLEGEVEGYEYILNFGATKYYKKISDRFHQHDLHEKFGFDNYQPDESIMLLDCRGKERIHLIFEVGGFAIINKYSTRGYLHTLDKMNRAVTFKKISDKTATFVHNSNEPIEVSFFGKVEGYIPPPQ